jgi:hypothetical protein
MPHLPISTMPAEEDGNSLFAAELRLQSRFPGEAAGGPIFGCVLRDGALCVGTPYHRTGIQEGQSPVGPNSLLV